MQVRHIFFRSEEDDQHDDGTPFLSPRQLFFKIHQEWQGKSLAETEQLWQQRCSQPSPPAQPHTS